MRTALLLSNPSRAHFTLIAVAGLGLMAMAPGCDCGSSSGGATADAGEMDVSVSDASTDGSEDGSVDTGPGTDAGPGDSSTGGDSASATGEAGPPQDAGDAAVCSLHNASGFTQALAAATVPAVLAGNPTGRTLAMALDENDDPMFAYVDEVTVDGGLVTAYEIMFTRWDACAGAFTTPMLVDENHGGGDVAIAYDPSTHEVGIAYEKDATDDNWADSYGTIWLASMRAPATSFSTQILNATHTCCHGNGTPADWPTYVPSIAMQGGHIYIAYETSIGGGGDDQGLVWFLSSSATYQTPPTSANGTGEYDAGLPATPPAHDFAYTPVPFTGTSPDTNALAGFAYPPVTSGTVSVAVDSAGAPALAVYEASGAGYPSYRTLFWRPGMSTAVVADAFTVDAAIDLSLAFHGTSPVIAGHQLASATSDALNVVSSTGGMTWSAPVQLANGGTAFTTALAFDGAGHGAIASDSNGSNPTCAANPYVAFSPDDGATWAAACPATAVQGYGTHSVNAAYGQGRLAGKLVVGFINNSQSTTPPNESGIVVWQSP